MCKTRIFLVRASRAAYSTQMVELRSTHMIVPLEGVSLEQRINESGRELDLVWEIGEGLPEVASDLDLKAEQLTGRRRGQGIEGGWARRRIIPGRGNSACPSSHGQSKAEKTQKEVREK